MRGSQVTCKEARLGARRLHRVQSEVNFPLPRLGPQHTHCPAGCLPSWPSRPPRPTMGSGPLPASLMPRVPELPPTASLQGASGPVPAAGTVQTPARAWRGEPCLPPLPASLPPPLHCSYLKPVVAWETSSDVRFRLFQHRDRPGVCSLRLVTHPE